MSDFGRFTALHLQIGVFFVPTFALYPLSRWSGSDSVSILLLPWVVVCFGFAFYKVPEVILSLRVRPTPVKAMRQVAAGAGLATMPVALEPIYRIPEPLLVTAFVGGASLFAVALFTSMFPPKEDEN